MLIEDRCQWKTHLVLSEARKGVVEGTGPNLGRWCSSPTRSAHRDVIAAGLPGIYDLSREFAICKPEVISDGRFPARHPLAPL